MKLFLSISIAMTLGVLLAGCDKAADALPPQQGSSTEQSKISQVFQPGIIGAGLAYLEQFTGVARSTDGHFNTKTYLVDGCELQAGYANNAITSLTLKVSPQCTFDLAPFVMGNQAVPVHTLTFGAFDQLFGNGATYYADCLTQCGNAYDPATYALHQGSRAEGFLEIMASSTGTYESAYQLAQVMLEHEGENWVMEAQFNCDPYKYRDIARELYKDHPIEKITIGHNLWDAPDCQD